MEYSNNTTLDKLHAKIYLESSKNMDRTNRDNDYFDLILVYSVHFFPQIYSFLEIFFTATNGEW